MSLSVTVAVLVSSLLLAFYDLAKKHSVRDNAVISVLFLATLYQASASGRRRHAPTGPRTMKAGKQTAS